MLRLSLTFSLSFDPLWVDNQEVANVPISPEQAIQNASADALMFGTEQQAADALNDFAELARTSPGYFHASDFESHVENYIENFNNVPEVDNSEAQQIIDRVAENLANANQPVASGSGTSSVSNSNNGSGPNSNSGQGPSSVS